MKIFLRIIWLGFLGVVSFFAHGQTIINTNHPNNNGNGSVIFNVQNTNAFDITIVGIQCHLGTTATNFIELLYRNSPLSDSAAPWDFGTVGAGQNGWISAGTGVVSNSDTANGIVPVLSSLSLTIPAGATYQLGLSATTLQYSTLTSGAGVNTFSGGGVNLLTGDGISWGGTVYPSTPANYPRGLIGGIQFIPSGLNFAVDAPATATAGTAFNFTVTAQDASNNVMPGYTGTVRFTSTDTAAVLPADATLTNGVGTFSATLTTAGSQTITATDTVAASVTQTSGSIGVSASTTGTQFEVSAPSTATVGTAFNYTVTALDPYNNTVTGYSGTVHFTSTDGAAVLPADATLTNGVGTFSATLQTEGPQTLVATDTVTSAITGASGVVTVSKKSTTVVLTTSHNPAVAGHPVTLTATVAGDPPTGTVSFADNGTPLPCSPVTLVPGTTSSTASCTASFTDVGVHPITATYLGDANFAAATSMALDVTVEAAAQPPVPVPVFDRWMVWLLFVLMGAIYWRHSKTSRMRR